jgi:hypothetical protein|tara:strand:- start:317 stop:553 length:237 start_codon:yes stop_codon:yes gene_type:complete
MIKISDTEIKERANNKIWSKIQMGQIHLEDLRQQLKAKSYRPFIDEEQQRGLIEHQKLDLKVLNYIYKLIELDNHEAI